jgi:hypothetical protein
MAGQLMAEGRWVESKLLGTEDWQHASRTHDGETREGYVWVEYATADTPHYEIEQSKHWYTR